MRGKSKRGLERQRQRIREAILADPSRSSRSIALEIKCSTTTVCTMRDRLDIQAGDGERTPNDVHASNVRALPNRGHENLIDPAEVGNTRAVRHAYYSPRMLAPRIERLSDEIRGVVVGYEPADDLVVRALATAAAQAEGLVADLNERGIVDGRGNPRAGVKLLNSTLGLIAKLADALGLTPASRRRLGLMRMPDEPRAESMVLQMAREAQEARAAWEARQNGGEP